MLLDATDVGDVLSTADWAASAAAGGTEVLSAELTYDVLVRPSKIVCVGLNYRGRRGDRPRAPAFPTLFGKFADTLCAPWPTSNCQPRRRVDWEAELTIVMGREAHGVDRSEALDPRRRLHGRQRRLDARSAEPHAAVAPGEELRGTTPWGRCS